MILKEEKASRIRFLQKTNPLLFDKLKIDMVVPLFLLKRLMGFAVLEANSKTYKETEAICSYFRSFFNMLIPLVLNERIQLEKDKNYYRIFRMDRLAMVGELAASAAHEIKNPLAGISTFFKYLNEVDDFSKQDILEEIKIMKQSCNRIDDIVKSLLSFSRFRKKKIAAIDLGEIIESSILSIGLKIPANIEIIKKFDEDLVVETDYQHFQQVLINILFNATEAIDKKEGEIIISTYVSGQNRLPSRELFHISIKDNGPGIAESFKPNLFQPFQTTREEGTGLGLYTCYGLMKSLGGSIDINSSDKGTEVILSLPYSFEEEEEEE
ncbi:MAG: hypothetical protein GY765_27870 [bacterium]|nr:hypothetical protein [bacterium]